MHHNIFIIMEKWEESKIKLFIKLLVLCKFDIDVKLDNKESKIVRSLMKDVEGLKVTQDQGCRAKLLNGRICSMLINDIGNPFWTTIGVNDYIANVYENDVDKAVYEICEEYFKYTILTLDEYSTILQHNAYYYYNHFEKSKPYMALIELPRSSSAKLLVILIQLLKINILEIILVLFFLPLKHFVFTLMTGKRYQHGTNYLNM